MKGAKMDRVYQLEAAGYPEIAGVYANLEKAEQAARRAIDEVRDVLPWGEGEWKVLVVGRFTPVAMIREHKIIF